MDVLSNVLRHIRLEGAFFFNGEFREPWCIQTPDGEQAARLLCPTAKRLAILHMVLRGRCYVQLDGKPPVALEEGDVVVLPTGDAHLLGGGVQHAPVHMGHLVDFSGPPRLEQLQYGGNGNTCELACGWFAFEHHTANPLFASLPGMLRASLGTLPVGAWLLQATRYALAESRGQQPGAGVAGAKVAEMLFVEALRAYLATSPVPSTGWLAALRDPQVSRCMTLMHQQPAKPWTVESLAEQLHMSRSTLAERFQELVGVPPMRYLKTWRLAVAARLLRNDPSPVIRVAEAVGYQSEASFSRAFKTEYGLPPNAWRVRREAA